MLLRIFSLYSEQKGNNELLKRGKHLKKNNNKHLIIIIFFFLLKPRLGLNNGRCIDISLVEKIGHCW